MLKDFKLLFVALGAFFSIAIAGIAYENAHPHPKPMSLGMAYNGQDGGCIRIPGDDGHDNWIDNHPLVFGGFAPNLEIEVILPEMPKDDGFV